MLGTVEIKGRHNLKVKMSHDKSYLIIKKKIRKTRRVKTSHNESYLIIEREIRKTRRASWG